MAADKEILDIAKQRFERSEDAESEWRDEAERDLEFEDGDQWPEDVLRTRKEDNRPCLVVNRVKAFIRQVVNDERQMRPAIKVRGVDSEADPRTAEVLNGMIRAIEQDSGGDAPIDWAAEHAVKMGRGYWRYITEYETERSFTQKVCCKRIFNQLSVYDDPDAQEADGSDRKFLFIVEYRDREDFEKEHGKVAEWSARDQQRGWYTEDKVRIAEYWSVEEDEGMLTMLSDGSVVDGTFSEEEVAALVEKGFPVPVAVRKTKNRRVVSRLISADKVLEETEWPGKLIPIPRVLGEEKVIEGETRYQGMVRDLKDPQRQYNYMRSASVERIALAPKAPWVGPEGSFEDPKWNRANRENYAYMEFTPVQGQPPPWRDKPPEVSSGLVSEVQHAAEELRAVSGIHDPALGARSNEVSGVAINARKTESDISNYHYMDNLARAVRYAGKVLVDLIPRIYTEGRMLTILNGDGSEEPLWVNRPFVNQKQKRETISLQKGRYDVVVDVGPSYTTQRQEALDSMIEIAKAFPQSVEVMGDLMAKNMDWPDADEFAKRLKLLLPPEILSDESPQIRAMMKRFEDEKNLMLQVGEQMRRQIEQLQNELQKEREKRAIDVAKIQEDARQADMQHQVDMTDLEIKANKDLGPFGVAQ